MGVRINVQTTDGESVVEVHGVLDQSLVEMTAAGLIGIGRDCRSVIVDLRDAVLTSPAGIAQLVDALREEATAADIALVCDRLPGRRLLRLACGPADVRVLREPPPGALDAAGAEGVVGVVDVGVVDVTLDAATADPGDALPEAV